MKKEDFEGQLAKANLTKKKFSREAKVPYSTVLNWNNNITHTPDWVESWLYHYVKSQKYEVIKKMLKDD